MVIAAYASGSRPARDVVRVLDRLVAARRFACVRGVLRAALECVRPTPLLLWRWVLDNPRAASLAARQRLAAAAGRDPRVERMCRHRGSV